MVHCIAGIQYCIYLRVHVYHTCIILYSRISTDVLPFFTSRSITTLHALLLMLLWPCVSKKQMYPLRLILFNLLLQYFCW